MKLSSLFVLFALSMHLCAQTSDSLKIKPRAIPAWTYWIPGASYYYQGKIVQGSIFMTLETGGIILGTIYDKNLKNNSASPYYNYPLLLGLQAFQTEKLSLFRNQLEIVKFKKPDFRYDNLSEKELYLAPFRLKNIFTPITGGMVLLAAIYLGVEKYNETNSFSEIDKMYFLDRFIGRNKGITAFGSASLAMSWGAGIGEEYICRNYMMPLMDYRYGQKKGLVLSSVIFGSFHFSNVLFADKPDYKATLLQVGEATLLGYFLGRDVQKEITTLVLLWQHTCGTISH
ncbi:MAG: CPBP family intramembrane metalloprotease [Bacteroidales bacterium]|nr:CPBP family intramembrane metalloprotease [Bacteroidales bacterium]